MKTVEVSTVSGDETACTPACPVVRTAQLIDECWKTLIVHDLLSGKKRYSELLASLQGIRPKMLAAWLRFLEEQGLVKKAVDAVVPPKRSRN